LPLVILPYLSDPKIIAREIERAVAKGHRGVIFPAVPMDLRDVPHVAGPEYDPIWEAWASLNVPLCFHAGASPKLQYAPYSELMPAFAEALNAVTKPVSSVFVLGLYLFSRVLLRHPKLRVVLAESALSWGMLYLEWADPFEPYLGAERILWSTNFPSATSTWPKTRQTIEHCFRGVSVEKREKVLWKNAASLYAL
jgi:predicted TIM-barrel fold metal-dependent hydrolase